MAKAEFSYAEKGMTRFPPNVEQVCVESGAACVWLVVRRNDVELRFDLSRADVEHLVGLLTRGAAEI